MHVFLTISPAGCKSADEALETETSPTPKSKPPSSLRCRRSAPALSPVPAQHRDQHRLSPVPAQHRDHHQAPAARAPEWDPAAKRARTRPAGQRRGAASGWELPGLAVEPRTGCGVAMGYGMRGGRGGRDAGWPWGTGPVGSREPRAFSVHTHLRRSHASQQIKTTALRAAS